MEPGVVRDQQGLPAAGCPDRGQATPSLAKGSLHAAETCPSLFVVIHDSGHSMLWADTHSCCSASAPRPGAAAWHTHALNLDAANFACSGCTLHYSAAQQGGMGVREPPHIASTPTC